MKNENKTHFEVAGIATGACGITDYDNIFASKCPYALLPCILNS